jgi:hypothetical protein
MLVYRFFYCIFAADLRHNLIYGNVRQINTYIDKKLFIIWDIAS